MTATLEVREMTARMPFQIVRVSSHTEKVLGHFRSRETAERCLPFYERRERDEERLRAMYDVLLGAYGASLTERVRLTFPNGQQRSGRLGRWKAPDHWIPTLDGHTLMGEILPCVRIELMRPNGRYRTAWEAPAEEVTG